MKGKRPGPGRPHTLVYARAGVLEIIRELSVGEKRFNELQDTVTKRGVSRPTLTRTLDHLVQREYVKRRVEQAKPVAVRYALTDRGGHLQKLLEALHELEAEVS